MPGSLLSAKSGRGVAVPGGGVEAPDAMSCSSSCGTLLFEFSASVAAIVGIKGPSAGWQDTSEKMERVM